MKWSLVVLEKMGNPRLKISGESFMANSYSPPTTREDKNKAVIPAKAGIHFSISAYERKLLRLHSIQPKKRDVVHRSDHGSDYLSFPRRRESNLTRKWMPD